jgi:hypothetical protein
MMLSAPASFDKAHSVFEQLRLFIESWTLCMLELIVSNSVL